MSKERDLWEVRKDGRLIRTYDVKKGSITEEDVQNDMLSSGYNLDDLEIEKLVTEVGNNE